MKLNNLFLTSVSALLLSVAGANAMTIRPFVGATMGLGGVKYSSSITSIHSMTFPQDFFAFGVEAGAKFGEYTKIYNGGFSLNFDKTTYSHITDTFTDEKEAKSDLMGASLMYDNYFRISGDKTSRIDFVLGAGLGEVQLHWVSLEPGLEFDDDKISSMAFAFKTGLDFELTKHITLSAMARALVPTRTAYYTHTNYIVGGAVKYLF